MAASPVSHPLPVLVCVCRSVCGGVASNSQLPLPTNPSVMNLLGLQYIHLLLQTFVASSKIHSLVTLCVRVLCVGHFGHFPSEPSQLIPNSHGLGRLGGCEYFPLL